MRLVTIKHDSLEEKVFVEIRRGILSGALARGQMLTQERLAEELGVSRIPVRAALKRLEMSGLVALGASGSYVVAKLTLEDIREIYELRSMLEPLAAVRGLPHLTDDNVADLERLAQEMNHAIQVDNLDQYVDLNERFHKVIYAASGSSRLLRMISDLWLGRTTLTPIEVAGQLDASQREHHDILEAVRSRSEEDLKRAIRDHIINAGTLLEKHLRTLELGEQ